VACALDEADRAAAAAGLMSNEGLRIELIEPDPEMYSMAYNVVSNATLWFCHHHLFDSARRPRTDGHWMTAWEAYRELNHLFARRVAEVAPEGGTVLVQDYHLALMGTTLAGLRPDLRTAHFTIPVRRPVGVAHAAHVGGDRAPVGHGRVWFVWLPHRRWAAAYRQGLSLLRPAGTSAPGSTFVSPLSTDPDQLRASVAEPAVGQALARIEERIGGADRQVIVRVDRMELSKNLLRGFWAFDELLEQQPHRRERVVFVALAYPTRQGLAEYLAYQNEVESTVARINQRWERPGWTPIVLEVDDDYPRSLAALSRYDVLLVNPVRDGMNLVAKEGPLVNTRNGALALSREAGAFDELGSASVEVNPFDVCGTAAVLAEALDMEMDQRSAQAGELRKLILARRPSDWLNDQLDAAR